MKIPLNMRVNGAGTTQAAHAEVLAKELYAARKGDWRAKNDLVRTFMPLISSVVQKRAADKEHTEKYVEAGKAGLYEAIKKYKSSVGPGRFQVFALDYIERSIDRVDNGGGFFARLFGGR